MIGIKPYRTYVYVDGFNFTHAMDSKKGLFRTYPICRVPNLEKLCLIKLKSFIGQEHTLECVRFFTARVNPTNKKPDTLIHQKKYNRYLTRGKCVTTHYGKFAKQKGKDKEKQSDVNLAAHLVNDSWQDKYDYATIISNDTDFCGVIQLIRKEFPEKIIDVWTLFKAAKDLEKAATFNHQITEKELIKALDINMLRQNGINEDMLQQIKKIQKNK